MIEPGGLERCPESKEVENVSLVEFQEKGNLISKAFLCWIAFTSVVGACDGQ